MHTVQCCLMVTPQVFVNQVLGKLCYVCLACRQRSTADRLRHTKPERCVCVCVCVGGGGGEGQGKPVHIH